MIKSRKLRRVGYVARVEESRSAFKILAGKSTEKRPLGRKILGRTLKNGINTRNWVVLAQDRDYWRVLVNAALSLRVL